jgi:hypothetical protein
MTRYVSSRKGLVQLRVGRRVMLITEGGLWSSKWSIAVLEEEEA